MTNFSGITQPGPQPAALSSDTRALILFLANQKSPVVAYFLWLFLGLIGGHNFYLDRSGVAIAQLILSLTVVGLLVTFVWVLVDAFLIPGWVSRHNNLLAARLGAS